MSSNSSVRNRSLDSGVTPRLLYQVVLPDPGKPIVNTTYPRGDFNAACSTGGVLRDSGCVSTTIVFSAEAGSNGTAIGSGNFPGSGAGAGSASVSAGSRGNVSVIAALIGGATGRSGNSSG